MTITVDNGPLWLQYLTGFGTAGAAIFAAWAAWVASRATNASRALVKVETDRDARSASERLREQARLIVVDQVGRPLQLEGREGWFVHVVVRNPSPNPIFKVRLKVVIGDAVWGPQLVGTITPSRQVALTAFMATDADTDNVDSLVRFVDVNQEAWVASARGALYPDPIGLVVWIEEARAFAARDLTWQERGTLEGVLEPPDLDRWLAGED